MYSKELIDALASSLSPLDGTGLSSYDLCRTISLVLRRDAIPHEVKSGLVAIGTSGVRPLKHTWIELAEGGVIVDFRLRDLAPAYPPAPHGVFLHEGCGAVYMASSDVRSESPTTYQIEMLKAFWGISLFDLPRLAVPAPLSV